MTYVLHGFHRSSTSWRVRIALQLKGIPFEYRAYHLRRDEQRTESFAALNPAMLVPVLETPDGERHWQSLAICELLEERVPEPPLLPRETAERARVRALAADVACDVHPLNNLRVLRRLGELGLEESAVVAWAHGWIETAFGSLEDRLASETATGRYSHGDAPSLADVCLVPQVGSAARFGVSMDPYPTIRRIAAACDAHPAFAAARPERQPDAE